MKTLPLIVLGALLALGIAGGATSAHAAESPSAAAVMGEATATAVQSTLTAIQNLLSQLALRIQSSPPSAQEAADMQLYLAAMRQGLIVMQGTIAALESQYTGVALAVPPQEFATLESPIYLYVPAIPSETPDAVAETPGAVETAATDIAGESELSQTAATTETASRAGRVGWWIGGVVLALLIAVALRGIAWGRESKESEMKPATSGNASHPSDAPPISAQSQEQNTPW